MARTERLRSGSHAGAIEAPAQVRTVREVVVPVLDCLLHDADFSGTDEQSFWSLFDLLTRESLTFPLEGARPAFSGICNDGTPWQFCVTLGAASESVRYLTEIGVPRSALSDRIALSRTRLEDIFRQMRFPTHANDLAEALFEMLPAPESELNAALWVAVAHGRGGLSRMRLYANNGWGDELARWMRLVDCLRTIGASGFARSLRDLLPILTANFSPAGFAVNVPDEPVTCKLYLRPTTSPWAACREIVSRLRSECAANFLAAIEKGLGRSLESIPDRAVLLSLAAPQTGGELDVKLDFCGHCVFPSDDEAARAVYRLANLFMLDESPYQRLLQAMGEGNGHTLSRLHGFVGIGADAGVNVRVNVYANPQSYEVRGSREELRSALRRGVEALLRAAEQEALWKDYVLPVGTSTTWVTAYVANVLLDAHHVLPHLDTLGDVCRRAGEQIHVKFRPGEGWGYHEDIETDADSTALCMLLLQRVGIDDGPARQALRQFGGYGTFRRSDESDAWGHMHADVLPTVLRALGEEASDVVLAQREEIGVWRSYWWESDLYATDACLRLLSESARKDDCDRSRRWLLDCALPRGAFEEALCAAALATVRRSEPVEEAQTSLLRSLLESQREDGSWPASAALRVTLPTCARPWEAGSMSGRLYLDRGTLTTATVVGAFARILATSASLPSHLGDRPYAARVDL